VATAGRSLLVRVGAELWGVSRGVGAKSAHDCGPRRRAAASAQVTGALTPDRRAGCWCRCARSERSR
jgi:hypothetical protein